MNVNSHALALECMKALKKVEKIHDRDRDHIESVYRSDCEEVLEKYILQYADTVERSRAELIKQVIAANAVDTPSPSVGKLPEGTKAFGEYTHVVTGWDALGQRFKAAIRGQELHLFAHLEVEEG